MYLYIFKNDDQVPLHVYKFCPCNTRYVESVSLLLGLPSFLLFFLARIEFSLAAASGVEALLPSPPPEVVSAPVEVASITMGSCQIPSLSDDNGSECQISPPPEDDEVSSSNPSASSSDGSSSS